MKNEYFNILSSLQNSALLAFNVQNIYHLRALCELSNENNTPVIAQFSTRYIRLFDELYGLEAIINQYKKNNVFFHLDHCKDFEVLKKCVEVGFDGVMYDGSDLSLNKNIANTVYIKNLIGASPCLLEGDVGRIGGTEDDTSGKVAIVDINDAVSYYEATNVDLLALGIGNVHGYYSDVSHVDINVIERFNEKINRKVLLVLHGTSGLNANTVQTAIRFGVRKINFSTDLKKVSNNFNQFYFQDKELFDEIDYLKNYTDCLKEFYLEHISTYGKC